MDKLKFQMFVQIVLLNVAENAIQTLNVLILVKETESSQTTVIALQGHLKII
jgi:hypothetical protein